MNYPFLITEQSAVLVKSGKRLIAGTGHPNFAKIVDHIRNKRFNNIERLFDLREIIEHCYNVTIKNNKEIFYKDKPIHNVVASKIVEYIRKGLPFKPMVKFMNSLMENPSQNSRDQLYNFIEKNDVCLAEDGALIFHKAIRQDMTDLHSGKFVNKPGTTLSMNRSEVADDPNSACAHGWHVGSWDFVREFGKDNSRYVICKVFAKDVVSVPHDAQARKVRVCRYTVVQEVKMNEVVKLPIFKNTKSGPKRNKLGQFC